MKNFESKIISAEKIPPKYVLLSLEFPDHFSFAPGQFVMVSAPEFKNENGIPVKRAYSITSSNLNKNRLDFCIDIMKKGAFTSKIISMARGETLNIEGPYGNFKLEKPLQAKTVFIAEESRIAPIMSMIRTIRMQNPPKKMELHYRICCERGFLYKKELEEYSEKNILKLSVSKKESSLIRSIQENIETQKGPLYVCATPEKVRDITRILGEKGFKQEQIKKEQW